MNEKLSSLPSPYALTTDNTELVFVKKDALWRVAHYGERSNVAADAVLLTECRYNAESFGRATLETYPSFGADYGDNDGQMGMCKYGAIQAQHADGNTTVQWRCADAWLAADEEDVEHVVFDLEDTTRPFRARQHFRAVKAADVIETWVELEHDEPAPVRLSIMDSFGLDFANIGTEFEVLSVCGQWACEAVQDSTRLARGQRIDLGSRSGVRDAWENNPAVMVSLGCPLDEDRGTVFAGALAWPGAWEISVQHTLHHILRVRAGAANLSGAYVLDAGKRLTLPKFVFTYSTQGMGGASRALHRWARGWHLPHGKVVRDVLLNSWEGAYFDFTEKTLTDMMDGTAKLGGELFVIDDGWFGRGAHARNDDTCGLGDWIWNEEKLPKGLAYLVKEANARGLKLGLWFEPEMANTASDLAEAHPDWIIREKNRPLRVGRGKSQVVLDMSNPAVRDAIFDQVDAVIRSANGLSYIKWDANADFMNAGSTYLDADHQANIWFDYTVGVMELIARLRAAHPEIVYQACSSGGAHADYGWLAYADEFWGSDNSCAQQRVFIQWGEELFYPACCVASHVTVSPNHQTHRTSPLKFRFDVAFSGRLGFELHPKGMTEEEIRFCTDAVESYKRLRTTIQQGDLYRLVSPYKNDHAALMFVSADRRKAVVCVYGMARLAMQGNPAPLHLRGLYPNLRYRITEINKAAESHIGPLEGKAFGGDALMTQGLPFTLGNEDDSLVLELTAE